MDTRSPNPDTVFVLFGAGGDLSQRLIVPALFNLHLDKKLPARFRLLGIDRVDSTATALAEKYREGIASHSRRGAAAADVWAEFAKLIDYLRMDVMDPAAYTALTQRLSDKAAAPSDHIFYMATPPSLFAPIARGLGAAGLARDTAHSRIVVEKPLGHDLNSFREINAVLNEKFSAWLAK